MPCLRNQILHQIGKHPSPYLYLQKLDEIFRKIDSKEKQAEEISESIVKQQSQVTQKRLEVDQQKLLSNNFQTEFNYKVEQFRNKINELKESLERQERASQALATRISQKKNEQEMYSNRKNELFYEIDQT